MDELLDKFPLAKAGLDAFERGRGLERNHLVRLLQIEVEYCDGSADFVAGLLKAIEVVKGVAE